MPPARMRGDGRKAANPKKTLLRLLSYLKKYWVTLAVVMVCIIINSVAQTTGSVALGRLVDEHILPMVEASGSDFAPVMMFLLENLLLRKFLMIMKFGKQKKNQIIKMMMLKQLVFIQKGLYIIVVR